MILVSKPLDSKPGQAAIKKGQGLRPTLGGPSFKRSRAKSKPRRTKVSPLVRGTRNQTRKKPLNGAHHFISAKTTGAAVEFRLLQDIKKLQKARIDDPDAGLNFCNTDFTRMHKLLRKDPMRFILENGGDFQNATFTNVNLENTNLQGLDLSGTRFGSCKLNRADLSKANCSDCVIRHSEMNDVTAYEANFNGSYIQNSQVQNALFIGADLSETQIQETNLSGAVASDTNCEGITINHCDLSGSELRRADLSNSAILFTNLNHAQMQRANLDHSLLGVHRDDYDSDVRTDDEGTDLSAANLEGASLNQVDFLETRINGQTQFAHNPIDTETLNRLLARDDLHDNQRSSLELTSIVQD